MYPMLKPGGRLILEDINLDEDCQQILTVEKHQRQKVKKI